MKVFIGERQAGKTTDMLWTAIKEGAWFCCMDFNTAKAMAISALGMMREYPNDLPDHFVTFTMPSLFGDQWPRSEPDKRCSYDVWEINEGEIRRNKLVPELGQAIYVDDEILLSVIRERYAEYGFDYKGCTILTREFVTWDPVNEIHTYELPERKQIKQGKFAGKKDLFAGFKKEEK